MPKKKTTKPSKKTTTKAVKKSQSIWEKQFFLTEQQEFFAAHPNAEKLLGLLILVVIGFFGVMIAKYYNGLDTMAYGW